VIGGGSFVSLRERMSFATDAAPVTCRAGA